MTPTRSRPKEDQNFWNFVFSIFFVLVLFCSLAFLYITRERLPSSISFFDVLLLILASFRITRLVVYDKVTRFFREWFVQKKEVSREGKSWVEIIPYTHGLRGTLHELVNCPWCIGMWSALIVTFSYFEFTWSWFIILFLAVAGVSSFVQIVANMIGWKAENLKHEALQKESQP
ncbi:DUF1360 domain-containing protein [Patescibacteria group bacterium]|nr:DUF1360 domain-containing protein [Patescibacteria group bacterium]